MYFEKTNALNARILGLRRKRRAMITAQDDDGLREDIRRLIATIEDGPERLETFDKELFAEIVELITAESKRRLRFRLLGGMELEEWI